MSAIRLVATAMLLLAVSTAVRAAGEESEKAKEAATAFEKVYGADFKRVKAARNPKDTAELAARLLGAAKEAGKQPDFLAVLCDKAAELGCDHPDGYATALDALELLGSEVPARADECSTRIMDIRQKQYGRTPKGDARAEAGEDLIDAMLSVADARFRALALSEASALCKKAQTVARAVESVQGPIVESRIKCLALAQRSAREAEKWRGQLDKDPQNQAARDKVVRLYLVDLDNPVEAARFIDGAADESLRKYVPAAAKPVEAVPELACMELGDWYLKLADAAPADAKALMFARAQAYYKRFLATHETEDQDRATAMLALDRVEAELKKAGGAPSPKKAKWIDLVVAVDPEKDAIDGKWQRKSGLLMVVGDEGLLGFPVALEGDYVLEMRFARRSGGRGFGVTLPVGSGATGVTLSVSWWDPQSSGLDWVDSKGGNSNGTLVKKSFANEAEHSLAITVKHKGDQVAMVSQLDGQPFVQWSGSQKSLRRAYKVKDSRCFTLFGRQEYVFRGLRVKMLSGGAKPLQPTDKAAGAMEGKP